MKIKRKIELRYGREFPLPRGIKVGINPRSEFRRGLEKFAPVKTDYSNTIFDFYRKFSFIHFFQREMEKSGQNFVCSLKISEGKDKNCCNFYQFRAVIPPDFYTRTKNSVENTIHSLHGPSELLIIFLPFSNM